MRRTDGTEQDYNKTGGAPKRLRLCLALGLLVVGSSVAMPLTAQEQTATAQQSTHRDWVVDCPEEAASCVLSTTTFAEDRTWLATLRLQKALTDGPVAYAQILVPGRIHLASGLFFRVDDGALQKGQILRCSPKACDIRIDLDEAMLRDWKRGATADVIYRPAVDTAPIRFPISLMGLTSALKQVGL